MIRTMMGALAAVLVSGVAMGAVTEAQLDKSQAQLDADHQQLTKTDQKATTDKEQKATTEAQSPAKLGGIPATGLRPSGTSKAEKSPAMEPLKERGMTKGAHDAAKADANVDASGSLGTGASTHTLKVSKGEHDAAKADANVDASGSLGTGASDPKTLKVAKGPHDAAKSDANAADASGSLGTGSSTHTLKNSVMLGGGQRNDGRSDVTGHAGVHGAGGGSQGHFGGAPSGGHSGVCHRGGGQGC